MHIFAERTRLNYILKHLTENHYQKTILKVEVASKYLSLEDCEMRIIL